MGTVITLTSRDGSMIIGTAELPADVPSAWIVRWRGRLYAATAPNGTGDIPYREARPVDLPDDATDLILAGLATTATFPGA